MLHPTPNHRKTRRSLFSYLAAAACGLLCSAAFPTGVPAVEPAYDLIAAINQYRQQRGLPAIAASAKLNAVAMAHVQDLATNHPEKNCGGNLHSWSTSGKWKGGCYSSNNQATWPIMWNKPQEIANYPSYGYEIAASGVYSAGDALNLWKTSAPHNAVILNQGVWSGYPWKAVGAACYGGYACVWFGTAPDGPTQTVLKVAYPIQGKTVVGLNPKIPKDIGNRVQRKK